MMGSETSKALYMFQRLKSVAVTINGQRYWATQIRFRLNFIVVRA